MSFLKKHSFAHLLLLMSVSALVLYACKGDDTVGLGRMSVEAFGQNFRDQSDALREYDPDANVDAMNVQVVEPDQMTFALNFIGQGPGSLGVGVYPADSTGTALRCEAVMVYEKLQSYRSVGGQATIFSWDTVRNEFSGDFTLDLVGIYDPSQQVTVSGRLEEITVLSFEYE
jgi:hypothetical protein